MDKRIEWLDEPLHSTASVFVDPKGDWEVFTTTVPNTEVRIGAIYALERIAQDSLRDHIPIMEILTAYIRENAPASTAEDHWDPDPEPLPHAATTAEQKKHAALRDKHFVKVRRWARAIEPDIIIQAAIQVIARRAPSQIAQERADSRYGEDGYRLDLRDSNLQAVDISGLNLSRALLTRARMEGANLREARMEGAHLDMARIQGANLFRAELRRAQLFAARMEAADLSEASIQNANLFKARMQEATLGNAKMKGARLGGVRMEGANLIGAHMEGVNLSGALMGGANLSEARMEGANLVEARFDALTGFFPATLRGAGLKAVDLSVLDLEFRGAEGLSALLSEAFADLSVDLPADVIRPEHWPKDDLLSAAFKRGWDAFQESIGYSPPD